MKKALIHSFRNTIRETERHRNCPFQEWRRINGGREFLFRDCRYCNEIFGLMPLRIPHAFDNDIRGTYNESGISYVNTPMINRLNSCPCQRFGIKHVRKILKEKGYIK